MTTPPETLDIAARAWFETLGLGVHECHYDLTHGFFAWRHSESRKSLTLWISRRAVEDYDLDTVFHMLRDFDPIALMAEFGDAHLHVSTHEGIGAYARDEFEPVAG